MFLPEQSWIPLDSEHYQRPATPETDGKQQARLIYNNQHLPWITTPTVPAHGPKIMVLAPHTARLQVCEKQCCCYERARHLGPPKNKPALPYPS